MKRLTPDKYLLDSEITALEALIKRLVRHDLRTSMLLELALKTGARESELLGITKSDLIPELKAVFIRGLKNSYNREIYLSVDFFERLSVYASALKTERLFPITASRVRQIWYSVRPCKKKFHAIRHSTAKILYKASKDIQLVQQTLGHKALANTMVYAVVEYTPEEHRKFIK